MSNSYDLTPYDSLAYPQSHPDRLATIAALFGLAAPSVEACRVLEIGCAAGGNLLPMAATLVGSHFIGIDTSATEIAEARRAAEAIGLANVELRHGSFTELRDEAPGFDYIIAHGIYSWIGRPLQAELLDLCAQKLAPHGVAYVSYNTFPGSATRLALRQLARLYARWSPTPEESVASARNLFTLAEQALAGRIDPYGQQVQAELGELRTLHDSYVMHEHLEGENEPCYFHEFTEAAAGRGLQYLGEAEIQTMGTADLPRPAAERLRQTASSLIEAEQFLDFARNRSFRQTLLCRSETELKRAIAPETIVRFHLASSLQGRTASPKDSRSTEPAEFHSGSGSVVRVADPLAQAALHELAAAWPSSLPFAQVANRAAARAQIPLDEPAKRNLALRLLGLHTESPALELRTLPPVFQVAPETHPEGLPLARWQARQGPRVVNGRHENIILGQAERDLLQRLDGLEPADPADELLQRLGAAALLKKPVSGKVQP